MANLNVFQRYAYSPNQGYTTPNGVQANTGQNMVVFAGGDMFAYINNIKVGNLESVTWSISVEVVGNYVMGQRDAVIYTTGKRVVVGSIVLSQYDRHALLEQVFSVSSRLGTNPTIGSLWQMESVPQNLSAGTVPQVLPASALQPINSSQNILPNTQTQQSGSFSPLMRGITQQTFNAQLTAEEQDAALAAGSVKFNYSDQLPPFDLTLVGVTKSGDSARCAIFGMQITQETAGFSMNDLGNSVGMSFVALAVSPWRNIDDSALNISSGTFNQMNNSM